MIEIDMEAKGLEEMKARLEEIARVAGEYKGVDLLSVPRESGVEFTNAQILSRLKETGRDFISPTDEVLNDVAEKFSEAFDVIWEGDKIDDIARRGRTAAFKGLTEAMKEYMRHISERIEEQRAAIGELAPLSPAYKAYKQKAVGFLDIGKFTGELLKNLNPSGPASRMKIIK